MLERSSEKFGHVRDFPLQALKGLADVAAADAEPLPLYAPPLAWAEVEAFVATTVREVARQAVGLGRKRLPAGEQRAMSANPYRLIVFDWDGTLMDSIGTIVGCAVRAARDVGAEDEGTAGRIRAAIGLALDHTARHVLPEASEDLREAWIERYRHHWLDQQPRAGFAFPGVTPMLETLRGAGYWLAVATGKNRRGLDREFEATGHGHFFLATRTVSEAQSKPHPEMLEGLLAELGVDRREALMVGDTSFDLDMAKNAGVDAVGVLTGSHDRDLLLGCGPVCCLESAVAPAGLAGPPLGLSTRHGRTAPGRALLRHRRRRRRCWRGMAGRARRAGAGSAPSTSTRKRVAVYRCNFPGHPAEVRLVDALARPNAWPRSRPTSSGSRRPASPTPGAARSATWKTRAPPPSGPPCG